MSYDAIGAMARFVAGLVLAPLLFGIINRIKAMMAGRKGPPLVQLYLDLAKLLGKGAVYSRTTTAIFRLGPALAVVATVLASTMAPLGKGPALVAFPGDFVVFAYLLAIGRFFTVIAALDVGSSFTGMGASREVKFSALAEPALLLCSVTVLVLAPHRSLLPMSVAIEALTGAHWVAAVPILFLVFAALLVVILAENARIPVDDPNTHLELTMIHEVMVLDHSGPDLALIQYGAALKLWTMGAVLMAIAWPISFGNQFADAVAGMTCLFLLAVAVGLIESTMARLRLVNVSHLLTGATALACLATFLALAGVML